MYRIRFHGRGGQGIKTASRILGTALFLAGFEVQDAPRYGAERRGAPIFAYVRADRRPINERGVITRPDLVAVADESLVSLPMAGVRQGLDHHAILLLHSATPPDTWQQRLNLAGPVITLALPAGDPGRPSHTPAARLVGAAARLLGSIDRQALEEAVMRELAALDQDDLAANLAATLAAYDETAAHHGAVREGAPISALDYRPPAWLVLPFEEARRAAPAIHAAATSVAVNTGLWRTARPVIDLHHCHRCWWLCSTFCPESAIAVGDDRSPAIDYDHCKGCMVCVAQCPAHAIHVRPETAADQGERS